jgi:hypothetical protein
MANTVLIKTRIQAENIDALNRKAKVTTAVPNGTPLTLAFPTAEGDEVFVGTVATSGLVFSIGRKEPIHIASGSLLVDENVDAWLLEVTSNNGVWLVASPEVNKNFIGEAYKGEDPRDFINRANEPLDVIYLEKGDIIQVTADFFTTAPVDANNTVTLGATGFDPSTV